MALTSFMHALTVPQLKQGALTSCFGRSLVLVYRMFVGIHLFHICIICRGWEFMDMRIFLTNLGSRISRLQCGQLDDVILYVLPLPLCLPSQVPNSRITSQINYLNSVLHLKLHSQGDKDKMVGTRTGCEKMLWDFGIGSLNSQTAVRICKQGHSDT